MSCDCFMLNNNSLRYYYMKLNIVLKLGVWCFLSLQ